MLNLHYNNCRRENWFATILAFNDKLELDSLLYPINKYQSTIEQYNFTSQALTNAKASQT